MRGIRNGSFLPLDLNIANNVELFLYTCRNAAGTQGEGKYNATAPVPNTCILGIMGTKFDIDSVSDI